MFEYTLPDDYEMVIAAMITRMNTHMRPSGIRTILAVIVIVKIARMR